jgi:hypothetical protein
VPEVEGIVPAVAGLRPSSVGERVAGADAIDDEADNVAIGAALRIELRSQAAGKLLAVGGLLVEKHERHCRSPRGTAGDVAASVARRSAA